ncbi:MAG: hypothetical protein NT070_22705 [Cyanobacteria bacterium]|nr:hypothetical protein [Cyanobacteriota bacterium]
MNKFNRILLASGLAATASLVANSPAFAGTTGKVDLSGTVPSSLAITVTPTSSATSMNLTPGSYRGVKIADITNASTNSPNGFKIIVTSSGLLVSGANSIPLIVFVEKSPTTGIGSGGAFSAYIANPLAVTKITSAGSAPDSSIEIGYDVPSNQAPGTYAGSITFTASDY